MKLSVQCYTLRDQFAQDAVGTYQAVKDMGLNYVELAGFNDKSPEDLRAILDSIGLQVSGSHVGLDRLSNDLEGVIADHQTVGCDLVILPWIDKSVYEGGWDNFAATLAPIAERLSQVDIRFAYHNHAFEFENDGLRVFFDNASPKVLAQLDCGWVYYAGADPADWIRSLSGRVPSIHLKEMNHDKDKWDAVAGTGKVDFDAILAIVDECGVEFGAIEMDNAPGDPLADTAACVKFFRAKGISE